MTIDLKTVKHISKLARISLDEKKAEKLATDMNSIFEFIEIEIKELKFSVAIIHGLKFFLHSSKILSI